MMLPSHLLACVLAGLLVSRIRPFGRREWALALGFGVVIDLDHLLQFPLYLQAHGLAALDPAQMSAWGGAWQGFMHDPQVAPYVIGVASLVARSWIPAAFWGLHMFQDFVIARHYVVFGSGVEWAIVAGLAAAVAGVLFAEHRLARTRDVTLLRHAAARFGLALQAPAAAVAGEPVEA